jgi:two-component system, response regulator
VPKPRVILLVEDDPNDKQLTLNTLSRETDCTVVVARDGAEALDYIFGTGAWRGRDVGARPCMVLLDLKLRKSSGFEVLKRIRADERTRLTPVVLLTSSWQEEDMLRGYAGGTNTFVRKPVVFERFVEAVGELGQYWLLAKELAN